MSDEGVKELELRVRAIEEWRYSQITAQAVRIERDRHIDDRFDRVEKVINEVKSWLMRIVWLILSGIIVAFLTFILQGGFHGP